MNKIINILFISAGAIHLLFAQPAPRPLPSGIYSVAEKSEDVIDFFLQNNWPSAQILVDSINASQDSIKFYFHQNRLPRMVSDLYDYFVFQLSFLIGERQDPLLSALVANQITRIMIELEGDYVHSVPESVPLMDYLGRELVILAKLPEDYGMLPRRSDELEKTWSNLRPQILLRNGQALAIKVDQTIDQIKETTDHQKIEQAGKVILDLVDEIENLFK
ncbi:MAG: hypothetical protein P8Y60_01045 [Calditrichota bacterium]